MLSNKMPDLCCLIVAKEEALAKVDDHENEDINVVSDVSSFVDADCIVVFDVDLLIDVDLDTVDKILDEDVEATVLYDDVLPQAPAER